MYKRWNTPNFQVNQNEKQPIFWRREGAVLVHATPARGPGFPIEAPLPHMRVERRLERRDQLLKLVERQTRQIQKLRGAGLHVGELYTGHTWCLLSWEAQYTINRDELSCTGSMLICDSIARTMQGPSVCPRKVFMYSKPFYLEGLPCLTCIMQ